MSHLGQVELDLRAFELQCDRDELRAAMIEKAANEVERYMRDEPDQHLFEALEYHRGDERWAALVDAMRAGRSADAGRELCLLFAEYCEDHARTLAENRYGC